ncbi:MAG: NAD(+)/NADH kinase [Candidatus Altiarchaeota archaeon]|nr:NAD(+)/NADH kinase [Candidatus Altiarchaeota archaeon]
MTNPEIFLSWNPKVKEIEGSINEVLGIFEKSGFPVHTNSALSKNFKNPIEFGGFLKSYPSGIIASLGGDGTLFKTIGSLLALEKNSYPPILPINYGRLGYLSEITAKDLKGVEEGLKKIRGKNYTHEELPVYEFRFEGHKGYFVNDLVVSTTHSIGVVNVVAKIGGYEPINISGDGVIVSTLLGSTAYNLSVEGPILLNDAITITPISPFSHINPLVLDPKEKVELNLTKAEKNISLSFDGMLIESMENVKGIIIQRTEKKIKIIRFTKVDLIQRLKRLYRFKAEIV